MPQPHFITRTLPALAIASLAACSSSGSSGAITPFVASLPGQAQMNAREPLAPNKSWIPPASKTTPLIYVSDGEEGLVIIYPANVNNPAPIGQLGGFDIAAGLAADKGGNLYVADVVNERVQVFHRGATTSFEILNAHGYAYGEAVDNSGNVYVAVAQTGSAQGFVAMYPPGATEPTSTLSDTRHGFSPVDVALDSNDNVFVSYDTAINTGPGGIDEFKAGSSTPIHWELKLLKESVG